jgi:preprotein translocase subunit SecE
MNRRHLIGYTILVLEILALLVIIGYFFMR